MKTKKSKLIKQWKDAFDRHAHPENPHTRILLDEATAALSFVSTQFFSGHDANGVGRVYACTNSFEYRLGMWYALRDTEIDDSPSSFLRCCHQDPEIAAAIFAREFGGFPRCI